MDGFEVSESSVAFRTGLSLAEVKKRRGPEGGRWRKSGAGRVLWSSTGVAQLEAELAQDNGISAAPDPITPEPVKTLVVARVRNPRALHVVMPGQPYDPARPLIVWLPRARGYLFRPGMKVLARARPHKGWVFDFEGNPENPGAGRRFPRRPGQW